LSSKCRQIVDAHYYQRQTAEEIARQSGRTAGAIRMALLRARKALGECIGKRLRKQR
jgi:DNA-directed RNA polymerase specialized sigma24 family protein